MNKNILIASIAFIAICLTAYGFINKSNPTSPQEKNSASELFTLNSGLISNFKIPGAIDFVYDIDKRYITTITKKDLDKASSVVDILPEKATKNVDSYKNSRISVLYPDSEITEVGDNEILNANQTKLLQSVDYTSDIGVSLICLRKSKISGRIHEDSVVYYITIIPENEAKFEGGEEALIKYLKEKSIEKTFGLDQNKIQPGKISFVIDKNGTIGNSLLISTCGYSKIDAEMKKLIDQMPGKWQPATNAKGEKVDQELVFFYGTQGC